MQAQDSKTPKMYKVLKLKCSYCGEELYVVFFCEHCGANLEFVEQLELTKSELSELMGTENVEFYGHPDRVSEAVSSVGGTTNDASTNTLDSLAPNDLDKFYDDGSLSAL